MKNQKNLITKDETIINFINGFLEFLYITVEKINNLIVKRNNK